jgi:hypothetical protein
MSGAGQRGSAVWVRGGRAYPVLGDSEHGDAVVVSGERGGEDARNEGHGGGEEVRERRREEGDEVCLPLVRPQQPRHRHPCPATRVLSKSVPSALVRLGFSGLGFRLARLFE